MHTIKYLFHIDSPQKTVFDKLTTVDGLANWWTLETSGSTAGGGIIAFKFGNKWVNKMKVIESQPNNLVVWESIKAHEDWIGTIITFALDRNENKTRIRFSHEGLPKQDDFYAACAFSWSKYMFSLKQLCETGKGNPFIHF